MSGKSSLLLAPAYAPDYPENTRLRSLQHGTIFLECEASTEQMQLGRSDKPALTIGFLLSLILGDNLPLLSMHWACFTLQ